MTFNSEGMQKKEQHQRADGKGESGWRVGRHLGRTLYLDGQVIGMVDTRELAHAIVDTMNGVPAQTAGQVGGSGENQLPARGGGPGQSFAVDVREFQVRMGLVHRDRPTVLPPEDWARRVRLIMEELAELATAQAGADLVGFADGLADLVWVVLGTAVEAGIPFDDVWAEVRRANMAKLGGVLDASGKLQKPAGWTPPDVARVLAGKVGP